MIGLDTNLLVRHLVADDAKQAELAGSFLEKHCTAEDPGYINLIVLCELAWTLDRTYEYSRQDVARLIDGLLVAQGLTVAQRDLAAAALQRYQTGALGFSDALICELNKAAGCASTATFDRKAARAEGFTIVG